MNQIEFERMLKDGFFDGLANKEQTDGPTIYSASTRRFEELLSDLTDEQLHDLIDRIGPTGNGSITVKACMTTIFRRYRKTSGDK